MSREGSATRVRTVVVPGVCPKCGADEPANCRALTRCIVNLSAALTQEDFAWAIEQTARIESTSIADAADAKGDLPNEGGSL